jgi:hypothetical protein
MDCRAITVLIGSVTLLAGRALAAPYSFVTIDDPLATANGTVATGVSDAGQVAGYYYTGVVPNGFVELGGVFTTINDPLGVGGTYLRGVNDSGVVAGNYVAGGNENGFVESGGVFTSLSDPNGQETIVTGINNADQVVGYYFTNGFRAVHGFVYSGGVFTDVDNPSAPPGDTFATGISNSGLVVGYSQQGFVDSGGTFTQIAAPSSSITIPTGVNNSVSIVGIYDRFDSHPFVYIGGTFRPFHEPLAAGNRTNPNGINDAGVIVGSYLQPVGVVHGFIATPTSSGVPEPAAWLLLWLGFGGMGAAIRDRARRMPAVC